MNNLKMVLIATVLLCSCVRYSELFPIPVPQDGWSDSSSGSDDHQDSTDADAFMINNGVSQQEIDEFHRLSGFVAGINATEEQGEGRSFGKIATALKFWNWSAFENFRVWIEERRRRTTTMKPIPVYIANNPHSYPYSNIYQSYRPSNVK